MKETQLNTERGKRFGEFLKDKKLSATDLAKDMGIARSSIYNYKNGETTIKDDHLSTLESKYGLNPEWYLHGNGAMYSYDLQPDMHRLSHEIQVVIGLIFDALPEKDRHLVKKLNALLNKQASATGGATNEDVIEMIKQLRDKIENRFL